MATQYPFGTPIDERRMWDEIVLSWLNQWRLEEFMSNAGPDEPLLGYDTPR